MKSKNSRLRDIKDYFDNTIEPGDTVLRAKFSNFEERKVVKVTECYLYVERSRTDYFPNLSDPLKIRLDFGTWQPHLINLTKLKLV